MRTVNNALIISFHTLIGCLSITILHASKLSFVSKIRSTIISYYRGSIGYILSGMEVENSHQRDIVSNDMPIVEGGLLPLGRKVGRFVIAAHRQ
jgi:hypothetical protein